MSTEPRYIRLLRAFTLVRLAKVARREGSSRWYTAGLLSSAAEERRAAVDADSDIWMTSASIKAKL